MATKTFYVSVSKKFTQEEVFGLPLKPHTHRNTIIAWANGIPVQYLSKSRGYWVCTNKPSWREDTNYRVKPQEQQEPKEQP